MHGIPILIYLGQSANVVTSNLIKTKTNHIYIYIISYHTDCLCENGSYFTFPKCIHDLQWGLSMIEVDSNENLKMLLVHFLHSASWSIFIWSQDAPLPARQPTLWPLQGYLTWASSFKIRSVRVGGCWYCMYLKSTNWPVINYRYKL